MHECNSKKNILIVTGGRVDMAHAALWLKGIQTDYVIAADRGGDTALSMGLPIDLLIGDLDSVRDPDGVKEAADEVRIFSAEKDDTDTGLALRTAIEMKPERIFILGGTGQRLDHTFTTVMSLMQTLESGVHCEIVDANNRIYIKDRDFSIAKKEQYGDFVSFVPVGTGAVLSLEGFRYDGVRVNVPLGSTLCQSNEVAADTAYVKVHEGVILVFESREQALI